MSTLLEQASLIMIPSGYKEDVVYSVIPETGAGDLSFTRASDGTRINSAGLVEVCPWNLLEQSNTFSNGAVWGLSDATVTGSQLGYDGTSNAWKLQSSGGTGTYIVQGSFSAIRTQSVYAKAGTTSKFSIIVGGYGNGMQFDLSNGTIVTNSNSSYFSGSITSVGNGWYYIVVTIQATAPTYGYLIAVQNLGGGGISVGDYIFIQNAQLNIGSTANPYFPTTDRLNVPRLTYQNGGGGCPSLLLEKQSTNIVLQSQAVATSPWQNFGGSISDNSAISPDGTQNANTLSRTGGGAGCYQSCGVDAGASYTATMWAKLGTATNICLVINNSIAWNTVGGQSFTTSNGLITNQWARVQFTFTAPVNGNINIHIGEHSQTGVTSQSEGSYFIWGVQIEKSSYPTSYIPTTSASATRVVDYTSRIGLALTNFTFAVNFKPLAYVVELFDFEKTGGGRMFYVAVQSNGFITFNSVSGGTIGAIGSVLTINQTCKLAFKLNASTSNLTVFINGSNIGTYTTNITTFGAFFGLQSFGYNPGTQIEQIAIFPSVLTDAECISLTTI